MKRDERPLNELHLFAGAGGGILGGILLGHTCVCAVEIEPYCRKVLFQRQRDGILPKFPIWDDVRTFDGKPWRGLVDVICGGFPCQDISQAGKRAGLEGERSGLWTHQLRIIGEILPEIAFVENSPRLTFRGLNRILADFARLGYDAQWGVLGGIDAGAPHTRKRMWILASNSAGQRREWRGKKSDISKGPWRVGQFERLHEHCASLALRSGKHQRMVDGVANRMDRLKASGNGQIPAVVRLAWETLSNHYP